MMFNLLFVSGHVFVNTNRQVRHVAKYAPHQGLVTPASLKETKRKNERRQSQVPILSKVCFVIVYDDRHLDVMRLSIESGYNSLE